ncbi:XRE family transcriptional regulator [Sulfurimicrobium lacus]|uniref:XRE family transcriptional regulator n=1 Tax=Sulfurimicrobium lacus TaxID=2715678 RepID=A0A6F8VDI8_9PROT|nr:RodZ domain-containing protein [Sulfurimicrobium lacus]BCB27778.1 XRE family transcriptional regulator [Sulfurimicrobium lacus]
MTELVSEEHFTAMEQESAGTKLARAREAQDLSVADVARALRLSVKQVEALEASDYDNLPGRTFVRGFVRNYARLVNLDPDRMVAEYFPVQQEPQTQDIQAPSQQISFSEHHRKPWLKWLLTSFVVVALVSWGVLVWLGPESAKSVTTVKSQVPMAPAVNTDASAPTDAKTPEADAISEQSLQPALPPVENVAPTQAPVPVPVPEASVAQARVQLSFSGPAWVEVRDKNGKKIHSQNNPAGTQLTLEGEPPLSLVIGSAPNVKLAYKGQSVDLTAYTRADVARLTLE